MPKFTFYFGPVTNVDVCPGSRNMPSTLLDTTVVFDAVCKNQTTRYGLVILFLLATNHEIINP